MNTADTRPGLLIPSPVGNGAIDAVAVVQQTVTYPYRLQEVSISKLFVDHANYQRPLIAGRVQRMAAEYDPNAIGTIVVNRRPSGMFAVIDGQYRVAATKVANPAVALLSIPAVVFDGLDIQQEANLFRKLNNVRPMNAIDKFKAKVAERDPGALEIVRVLGDYGFHVANDNRNYAKGRIRAVAALEDIYVQGGIEWLRRTMQVIRDAFQMDERSTVDFMMRGVFKFIVRYDQHGLNYKHLVHRLSDAGVGGVQRRAETARELYSMADTGVVPRAILSLYNYRMTASNRLPAWEATPRTKMTEAPKGKLHSVRGADGRFVPAKA